MFDYEGDGKHRLLGEADTNALSLRQSASEWVENMQGERTQSSGAQPSTCVLTILLSSSLPASGTPLPLIKGTGSLVVRRFDVEVRHSFLDYLQAGTEMSFMVAVVGVDVGGKCGAGRRRGGRRRCKGGLSRMVVLL